MIKVIVFDLDDTLISEYEYVQSGFRAVAHFLKDPLFYNEAMELFDQGIRGNIFNQALEKRGLKYDESLIKSLVTVYREHPPDISLLPGSEELIYNLKNRFQLALITDGHTSSQRSKIKHLDLEKLFDKIIVTDELAEQRKYWKPHHYPFQLIENHFNVSPSQCIYIGDNIKKDFIAPNARGWSSVLFRHSKGEYQHSLSDFEKNHHPQYQINDLLEINNVLEKIS